MLAIDAIVGGFEKERFLTPGLIDSNLLCPICLAVFRPPIIQLACSRQHQFCQVCIEKWFAERINDRTCPCCRSPVVSSSSLVIVQEGALVESLSTLELHCRHQGNGCSTVVALSEISRHEIECPFQAIRCSTPGCHRIFAKNQQDNHLANDCPRCSTCGYSTAYQDGKQHTPEECLTLQRTTPFQGAYWEKLVSKHADVKALATPSEVVEVVSISNQVIAVCKDGELLAVDTKRNGNTNGSSTTWHPKGRAVFDGTSSAPANFFHAAVANSYDNNFIVFLTLTQSWQGIFYINSQDLMDDDDHGKVKEIPLRYFVNGSKTHESTSRLFRGLAFIEQYRLLVCCHECPNVIGLWSLPDEVDNKQQSLNGRLLYQICMPSSLIPECEFAPFKCATFLAPTSTFSLASKPTPSPLYSSNKNGATSERGDILLAVSEFENDRVHLFTVSKMSATTYNCDMVQTIAKKGTLPGSVWRPRSLCFDPAGNLLIADSGNNRLQIFSALNGPVVPGQLGPANFSAFLTAPGEVVWQSIWTSSPFLNNCQTELEQQQLLNPSYLINNNQQSSQHSPLSHALFRRRMKPHPHWTSSLAVHLDANNQPMVIAGFYDNKHILRFFI